MAKWQVTTPDGQNWEIDAPAGATEEQVKTRAKAEAALAPPPPSAPPTPAPPPPGELGGNIAGQALGPGPDRTGLGQGGPAGEFLRGAIPTEMMATDLAEQGPRNLAVSGAATLAPMMIPGAGAAATMTSRVLRGAARTIAAGGAGAIASSAFRGPGFDLRDPANQQAALIQLATNALPQLGAEILGGLTFNAAQQRALRDTLETPADRLARTEANKLALTDAMAQAKVAERVQTIGEQSAGTQVQAALDPLVALPSQLASKPMGPPVVGETLKTMFRGEIGPKTEARRRSLYGAEVALGNEVAGKRTTAPLVEPAKVVLGDIARLEQELGREVEPKLKKRLHDLVRSGSTEATAGVPLYTSSEAKAPTAVGAKPSKPLDWTYGDHDEMRQLLQPYVTRYEARAGKRTAEQGAIDGLMADLRSAMGEMRLGHPDLERQANRADDFYVHSVKPVRDVAGVIASNPQPSMIAKGLLADGAPDRLFHAVRTLPPAMANTIRAAAWEDLFAKAKKPNGAVDARLLATAWEDLQPRQQLAIAGGRYKHVVNDAMRILRDTSDRAVELASNRRIVDSRLATLASELERADLQVTSALDAQTAALLKERSKAMAVAGVGAGLGMAMAHFANGNSAYGMAELGMGGAVASRVAARMLSSEPSLKLLDKMNKTPPGTRAAVRFGSQLVATVLHDFLDAQVESYQEPFATSAPPAPAPAN